MEWTEELGFDQIWLTEHHFIDYGLSVDPASLAATAAAAPGGYGSASPRRSCRSTTPCGWPSRPR